MQIKKKYAYKQLERKASGIKRDVCLINLEKAKKIGVIWQLDHLKAFHYINDHFKEKRVIFRSLCYTGESNEIIANSFNKKDVNWLGFPKTNLVHSFMDTEFDILINISPDFDFPLLAVSALSKSKLKVGSATLENNYNDFSIELNNNNDPVYLVKQQLYYLEQINNNTI